MGVIHFCGSYLPGTASTELDSVPSLTRCTSGYVQNDEYERLGVVSCCLLSVVGHHLLPCGFAHCRISAVVRWPALRVCQIPAGNQWLATVLCHGTSSGHMFGELSPSLPPPPGVDCDCGPLRLHRHLCGAWKGGLKGLIWGLGCHGFWPLGDHGRVPEHEGLDILNTSPQASPLPMNNLRPEKVIHVHP